MFRLKFKKNVSKQSVWVSGKDAWGQKGGVKGKLESIKSDRGQVEIGNEKCRVKCPKVSKAVC